MTLNPVKFLMAANMGAAAIGLVQGLAVAALLGPAQFGVIGIFVMLGWLCTNFWDVRLTDVATKLHVAETNTEYRTRNATACLGLTTFAALLMALSTVALGHFFWPWFTKVKPEDHWLVIQGCALGCVYLVGSAVGLLRLTNSFIIMGLARILNQIIYAVLLVLPLWLTPTIEGYYQALLPASLFSLALNLIILWWRWYKCFGYVLHRGWLSWQRYGAEWRFLIHTNVMGYSKLLNRGADVLVFGFFADDAATGIYRLAKALVDGLGGISEALSSYFFPTFMQTLSSKNYAAFQSYTRQFLLWGSAASLILAFLSLPLLFLVNIHILRDAYDGLAPTVCLMMLSYIFVWGVHIWLWPALIQTEKSVLMMKWSFLGGLVQLGILALACYYLGAIPWLAGAALLCYYLVTYVPLLFWWHQEKVIRSCML